jgi:hypothetical protein
MLVVKPCMVVESPPGAICQTLCGVPGFWFSRTIGFELVGIAEAVRVAVAGAAVEAGVIGAAVIGAVVSGITAFLFESNGRLTLL